MDCQRSNELISLLMDGLITDEEKAKLNEHVDTCEACKEEYDLIISINDSLAIIGNEEVELPSGFHEELMKAVNAEQAETSQTLKTNDKANVVVPLWKRMNKSYMNVAAVMVLVLVFALIGVNNLDTIRRTNDSAMMESETMMTTTEETTESAPMMEVAEEAAVEMEMSPSMVSEESSDAAVAEVVMEEAETSTMMSDEEAGATSAEAPVVKEETAEETDLTSLEESPVTSDVAEVQEMEEATTTVVSDEEASDEKVTTESQLARNSVEEDKSPKGADNSYASSEHSDDWNLKAPKGLGVLIFGGFIGITFLGAMIILKKVK